ncbi:MAG TPA: Na+/H+ antiporter NhaA, partial [Mycobacterium sp.]|nr:Na+/H+ antiporter NhaA [Mycobacterium sp.]
MADPEQAAEPEEPEATPLLAPRDGVPRLSVSRTEIASAADLLASGHGPFAVDAERASGFRYSNRAYLVQIRRAGAGTVLIDPVNPGGDPVTTLAPIADVLSTDEWVLHAADQDLPCLAEVGIRPPRVYDTELAGRLAGFERVNLAAMVQRLLGLQLMKGHGAADWSKRPLPYEWLNYAALDVEVLLDLRDAIADVLMRVSEDHEYEAEDADFRRLEFAARESRSPLERLETALHPWVGFVIMPLFALANAGVALRPAGVTDSIA